MLRSDDNDITKAARAILDETEPSVDRNQEKASDRRRFALGLFLVSIFLVSLAGILPAEDRLFWGSASFVILVAAAWQWDRARRQR